MNKLGKNPDMLLDKYGNVLFEATDGSGKVFTPPDINIKNYLPE